jgi:hypothetical protein
MFETVDSRMKKLERETKSGTSDEELVFTVYLVKCAKTGGSILRREWPSGKYAKIDPALLGISPYTPQEPPMTRAIVDPPVSVAVPAPTPPMPDNGELDGEDFYRWFDGLLQ